MDKTDNTMSQPNTSISLKLDIKTFIIFMNITTLSVFSYFICIKVCTRVMLKILPPSPYP